MLALFLSRLRYNYFAQFCLVVVLAVFLLGIFAPWLTQFDPTVADIRQKYLPMSEVHWFGTDHLGRDIFARILFGIRVTVFYALWAMFITLLIGIVIGMIAGVFGKKVDEILMRLCDVMLSFPSEVMILALVGILGAGIEHILLAVVLVKWAWYARMIRGTVIQYMHKNYIRYAQTIGESSYQIIYRHLLPVTAAEIMILGSADIGAVILLISALSFLGLGVQAPVPEWGSMLSDAKNIMILHPEQMLPAGIAIVLVVVAFNGLGDFLRDVFDPDNRINFTKVKTDEL